jgi:hypothetical protein
MREIGDWITLNHKKEDHPMIGDESWDHYINCQIVFIGMDGRFRVRRKHGYESIVEESEII